MDIEIISVGTEILMGNIVNTDAQFIAAQLNHLGIDCYYQTVVGDNPDRLREVLDIAFGRSQGVILSGGLGPTKDDLTKEMLMDYFHTQPVLDQQALDMMAERLRRRGITELSESQRKQAVVPDGAIIMYNHNGTAPGCIIEDGDRVGILLPGPPQELQPMFKEYVTPYLEKHSDKVLVSYNVKLKSSQEAPLAMVGEAPVADCLGALLDHANPTVATYAKTDGCLIRITAAAKDRESAKQLLEPMYAKCKEAIGEQYIKTVTEE